MSVKSHSGATIGRPMGAKGTRAEQWARLGDIITQQLGDRLAEELGSLTGKDYVDAASKILSYFRPRYVSTTVELNKGLNTIKAITFDAAPPATKADVQRFLREKAAAEGEIIEEAEVVSIETGKEPEEAEEDLAL